MQTYSLFFTQQNILQCFSLSLYKVASNASCERENHGIGLTKVSLRVKTCLAVRPNEKTAVPLHPKRGSGVVRHCGVPGLLASAENIPNI